MPHTYFIFDGDFDQFLNPTKLKKEGCIILSYVDVRFFVNSFSSIFTILIIVIVENSFSFPMAMAAKCLHFSRAYDDGGRTDH